MIFVAGGRQVATPLSCKALSYSLKPLSGVYDVKAIGLGPELPWASGVLLGRAP